MDAHQDKAFKNMKILLFQGPDAVPSGPADVFFGGIIENEEGLS